MSYIDKLKIVRNELKILSNSYELEYLNKENLYKNLVKQKNEVDKNITDIQTKMKIYFGLFYLSPYSIIIIMLLNGHNIILIVNILILVYSIKNLICLFAKYYSLNIQYNDIAKNIDMISINNALLYEDKEKILEILDETCNMLYLDDELKSEEYISELPERLKCLRFKNELLNLIK